MLTRLTECHNHHQQHTQEQWHQCSLARHSAMEDYGKCVCPFNRKCVGLAILWPKSQLLAFAETYAYRKTAHGRRQWRDPMSYRSWRLFQLYLEGHAIREFVVS